MAEVRANLALGGYDDKFVNKVDDDLICGICILPLNDPIQTRCGHRFCRVCLDGHLNSNRFQPTCPVDRFALIRTTDLFPDEATKRKILSLSVHCPSEGCQWTGALRSKDAHLETCPLRVVSCTNANCDDTMTRNNLQAHVTTTCPLRILRCNHCGASSPACRTEAHDRTCRRKPLDCPKSCGAVIPREELATHYDNDCPLTITPCPYAEMGCTAQVQRRQIETHLKAAVQPHLDLACAKLNNTQEELKISQDTTSNLALRVTELENQEEFPPYLWPVTNFWEKVSKAKNGEKIRIDSDFFYLGLHGYKMKLILYPNGCTEVVNAHISLFCALMKGQYDAILRWPFRYKGKLTLIDQNPDLKQRQNYSKSLTPGPKSIQRPKSEENAGWGFGAFLSHEELRKNSYVVDETLFIKFEVNRCESV